MLLVSVSIHIVLRDIYPLRSKWRETLERVIPISEQTTYHWDTSNNDYPASLVQLLL